MRLQLAIKAALDDDFNTPEMFAAMFPRGSRAFNGQMRLGAKDDAPITLRTAMKRLASFIDCDQGQLMSLCSKNRRPNTCVLLDDMLA